MSCWDEQSILGMSVKPFRIDLLYLCAELNGRRDLER